MRQSRVWFDRLFNLFTVVVGAAALYFLTTERLIPALRGEPARVAVGDSLPRAIWFEPLGGSGVPVSSKVGVPGARATLLLVFNSSCPACYANVPAWRRAIGAANGAVVLAVGLQSDRGAARAYARRQLAGALAVVPGDPHGFIGTLGIEVVPFTALIGAEGAVRFLHQGRLDEASESVLVGALGALTGSSP